MHHQQSNAVEANEGNTNVGIVPLSISGIFIVCFLNPNLLSSSVLHNS